MEEKDNGESIEFLNYLRETQKFPFEMEALKSTIQSNKTNVNLAEESIKHFTQSRSDNRIAIFTTLGVSVFTLIILIVQTTSVQKTQLEKPIKLEPSQVKELLQERASSNLLLTRQLDSLKSELQKLTKTLNSTYLNSLENETSKPTTTNQTKRTTKKHIREK